MVIINDKLKILELFGGIGAPRVALRNLENYSHNPTRSLA